MFGTEAIHIREVEIDVVFVPENFGSGPMDAARERVLALDVLLELGEAKVAHLDVPFIVQKQVERFEIAMYDAYIATTDD